MGFDTGIAFLYITRYEEGFILRIFVEGLSMCKDLRCIERLTERGDEIQICRRGGFYF
jgi:hypothetical protein